MDEAGMDWSVRALGDELGQPLFALSLGEDVSVTLHRHGDTGRLWYIWSAGEGGLAGLLDGERPGITIRDDGVEPGVVPAEHVALVLALETGERVDVRFAFTGGWAHGWVYEVADGVRVEPRHLRPVVATNKTALATLGGRLEERALPALRGAVNGLLRGIEAVPPPVRQVGLATLVAAPVVAGWLYKRGTGKRAEGLLELDTRGLRSSAALAPTPLPRAIIQATGEDGPATYVSYYLVRVDTTIRRLSATGYTDPSGE